MNENDLMFDIIKKSNDSRNITDLNNVYFIASDNGGIEFLVPQVYSGIEKYHNTKLLDSHLDLLHEKFNIKKQSLKFYIDSSSGDYLFGAPHYLVTITS